MPLRSITILTIICTNRCHVTPTRISIHILPIMKPCLTHHRRCAAINQDVLWRPWQRYMWWIIMCIILGSGLFKLFAKIDVVKPNKSHCSRYYVWFFESITSTIFTFHLPRADPFCLTPAFCMCIHFCWRRLLYPAHYVAGIVLSPHRFSILARICLTAGIHHDYSSLVCFFHLSFIVDSPLS